MKVLLVEDEEFIRDLFKRQLDLSGFNTDAFGTGKDGLSALSKNAYDLVLLDIMLPDINGLQILQTIRQNQANKGIAVVLLTNLGQDAVIKQGFELGADGYLVKAAYTPDQIVQEVKNIMQKKQTQPTPAAEVSAPAAAPTDPMVLPQAHPEVIGPKAAPIVEPPPPLNLEPRPAMMNPAAMSGIASIPGAGLTPPAAGQPTGPSSSEIVSQAASASNMELPNAVAETTKVSS